MPAQLYFTHQAHRNQDSFNDIHNSFNDIHEWVRSVRVGGVVFPGFPFIELGNYGRLQPYLYCRGVVLFWPMFVFLAMLTLYPDGRQTGFAKATKTSRAAKVYWRQLRSHPVLESEYFERW